MQPETEARIAGAVSGSTPRREAGPEVDLKVEYSPAALVQYLLGTRMVIGDFDRHLQGYELQFLTTLSVLATVGVALAGLFAFSHTGLTSSLVLAVGSTGLVLDLAYYIRMRFFVDIQREVMETTKAIEDEVIPKVMGGAGIAGDFDRFKLTARLLRLRSPQRQLQTMRFTTVAFGLLFLATVAWGIVLFA